MSTLLSQHLLLCDAVETECSQQVPAHTETLPQNSTAQYDTPWKVKLKHTISNLRRRLSRAKQKETASKLASSASATVSFGRRLTPKQRSSHTE